MRPLLYRLLIRLLARLESPADLPASPLDHGDRLPAGQLEAAACLAGDLRVRGRYWRICDASGTRRLALIAFFGTEWDEASLVTGALHGMAQARDRLARPGG